MEPDQDYANATLIVRENENYSIVKGTVNLTTYKSIIHNIRFSDFLNNPGLVAKPGEAVKPTKITIKTESGDQNIRLSDIVIATENKDYRWNPVDRREAGRSSLKKEFFSFSTEDNQYQANGYVFNLKKQMKKNFIIISDDTPIEDLFPEKTKDKNYATINDLVKGNISNHTFIAINPKYFIIQKNIKKIISP